MCKTVSKKVMSLAVSLCLLAMMVVGALPAGAQEEAPVNLLPSYGIDGTFETATTTDGIVQQGLAFVNDAHAGSKAAKITGAGWWYTYANLKDTYTDMVGKTYRLSLYYKGEYHGEFTVANADASKVLAKKDIQGKSDTWQKLNLTFTLAEDSIAKDGSGNQLMRIGTDVNNSNNKELYIDDVELFEVEPLQPEEGNLLGLLFDPDNVSNINSGWDGDGWMHWVNTGASPSTSASIDDTVAKTGISSFKLDNGSGNKSNSQLAIFPTLTPGKTYEVSAWVKTDNIVSDSAGVALEMQISEKDAFETAVTFSSEKITGTKDWTLLRMRFTYPENAKKIRVCLMNWDSTGAAWFDAVTVKEYTPFVNEGDLLKGAGVPDNYISLQNLNNTPKNDKEVVGWTDAGNFDDVFALDTAASKLGGQSFRITNPDTKNSGLMLYAPNLTAGKTYTFKAYVKTKDVTGEGAHIRIGLLDENGLPAAGTDIETPKVTGTKDWTLMEFDAKIPEGYTGFELNISLWNSKGTAWFDGVVLYEGALDDNEDKEPEPNPNPDPDPDPNPNPNPGTGDVLPLALLPLAMAATAGVCFLNKKRK